MKVKVTLNFSQGKFNQIYESMVTGGNTETTRKIITSHEDSKIVLKYNIEKSPGKEKKIIYTFFSI